MLRNGDDTRKNPVETNYSTLNAPGEKQHFHPLPDKAVGADTVSHGDGTNKNPYVLANMDYAFLNTPKVNFASYSVPNLNQDVGNYTVVMGGRSPGLGKADPDIIDSVRFAEFKARKVTDKNKYKDSIWKLHFSVHPDDVEKAWGLVYPELMKKGFPHFKVTRMKLVPREKAEIEKQKLEKDNPEFKDAAVYADYLKLNSDIDTMNRVCDGMQITIYITKDQEKIYNEFGLKIENLLHKHNIRPGIINPSDRVLGLYFSLRQENSSIGPDRYVSYDQAKYYMFDAQHDPFKASKLTWRGAALNYDDLDFVKLIKHVNVIAEKLSAAEKDLGKGIDLKSFKLIFKSYRRHLRQIFDMLLSAKGNISDAEGLKALIQSLSIYTKLIEMGEKHNIQSAFNKDKLYTNQLIKLQKYASNLKPKLARKKTISELKQPLPITTVAEQPARPKLVRKPAKAAIKVDPEIIKRATAKLVTDEMSSFSKSIERKVSAMSMAVQSMEQASKVEISGPETEQAPDSAVHAPRASNQGSPVSAPVVTNAPIISDEESGVILADQLAEVRTKQPTSQTVPTATNAPSLGDSEVDSLLSNRSSIRMPTTSVPYKERYNEPTKPNTWAYVLGGIALALVVTIIIVASSGVAAGAIAGLGAIVLAAAGTTATATAAASLGAAIVGIGMAVVGALTGLFAKKSADKSYEYYKMKQQADHETARVPVGPVPTKGRAVPVVKAGASSPSVPVSPVAPAPTVKDSDEESDSEDSLIIKRKPKTTSVNIKTSGGAAETERSTLVGSINSDHGMPSIGRSSFGTFSSSPRPSSLTKALSTSQHDTAFGKSP